MWTWEFVGGVGLWHGGEYHFDSFHADDSRIWVESGDSTTKGWYFGDSGSPPTPLSNLSSGRPNLDFIYSPFWKGGPSFIKNVVTGKEVFRLSGKYAKPYCARWDGQYLVAGYKDGVVLILDFKKNSSQ
jgi:hypothetical protein